MLLALVAGQIVAYMYYMLSYIPFGRQMLTKILLKLKDWCIQMSTSCQHRVIISIVAG